MQKSWKYEVTPIYIILGILFGIFLRVALKIISNLVGFLNCLPSSWG
jgi:hypothetical protein